MASSAMFEDSDTEEDDAVFNPGPSSSNTSHLSAGSKPHTKQVTHWEEGDTFRASENPVSRDVEEKSTIRLPLELTQLLQEQPDVEAKRLMEKSTQLAMKEWEQERQRLIQEIEDLKNQNASAQHRYPSQLHAGSFKKKFAATSVVSNMYKKTTGTVDMSGPLYEVKLAALFYIRAINSKQPFQLATNMAAAGAFDDIVLRRYVDDKWRTTFTQLKHKASSKVGFGPLLSMGKNSDFGLVKHAASYNKIKKDFETADDLKCCGLFEDFQFIMYTNALADIEVDTDGKRTTDENEFSLSTGSEGLIHSFDTDSQVFTALEEIVKFKALLIILISQMEGVDDEHTRKLVTDSVNMFEVSSYNTELVAKKGKLVASPKRSTAQTILQEMSLVHDNMTLYADFLSNMQFYTGQANYQIMDSLIAQEITEAFCSIDNTEAMTLSTELISMIQGWWSDKESTGPWLTHESTVWQSIIALRVAQLSKLKTEEFAKEKITFTEDSLLKLHGEIQYFKMLNIIVKEGTKSMIGSKIRESLKSERHIFIGLKELIARREEVFSVWRNELCDGLVIDCDEQLAEDEVKMIAREMETIISEQAYLRCVLVSTIDDSLSKSLSFTKLEVQCSWQELKSDSQKFLLSRKVLFQGHWIVLNDLINEGQHLSHLVISSFLSQVAKGEHKIGRDLDSLIDYYIPRKLSRGNTSINIGSLTDVPERTVLVIAEPGMGKTTLLTHLAQAAKTADPTTWVVRINLIDCTSYLATLDSDKIDTFTAIEFLTTFSLDWKESIFMNRLNTYGNVVALIDGVDELYPIHEDKICLILKQLQEANISKIFVVSRIAAKKTLERSLEVKSFSLEAFTLDDQKHFFEAYWKPVFVNDECSLNGFVRQIIILAVDTFREENMVIGIPLQTRMLAEYLDEYIEKYQKTRTVQVPERINLLKLFERFVEKKMKIHFEEKKKDDVNNAVVNADNESMKKLILANHMHAALEVLLSPEELRTVKSTDEMYKSFLDKIEKGHEKMGIITTLVNNRPQFLHRTFCDYFAALWISQNYLRCRSFLQKSLFEPRFQVVRNLLDMQLSKSCDLQAAVINCDLSTVDRLLSSGVDVNWKDDGGRTALHLATAYCGRDKQQQQQIVQTLLAHGARVDDLDDLLHWSPLRYADNVGAWAVAGLILQAGGHEADMVEAKSNINTNLFTQFIAYLSDPQSSYVELMLAASRHRDMPVVKFLVEDCHADVNCRGVNGVTPMHMSAQCGNLETILDLLENHAYFEITDDQKNTPIHYAASQGQTKCVKHLLELGSAVDARNVDGWTPLMYGARFGDTDTLVTLINEGAEVNASNTGGWTPLLCAMAQYHEEASMLLIAVGADVNARSNEGLTPLMYATHHGNTDLMDCLIQNGAKQDTNKLSHLKTTHMNVELLCATFQGNVALITDLIENGASFNCSNTQGTTPIHWAVMKNYQVCVKMLLNAGADINARDNQGLTALFNVCNMTNDMTPTAEQEQEAIAMLELLVQSGSDFTAKTNNGYGISAYAIERKQPLIKQYIQAFEESMNDLNGNSILHISAKRGYLEIVRYLLGQGADLAATNNDGDTIQHLTCAGGSIDVLKYLVCEQSADVAVTNNEGLTLQQYTSMYGKLDMLRYLVFHHKIDLTVRDKNGDTLQHYTSKYGKLEVLKYLVDEHSAPLNVTNNDGDTLQHYTCKYGMIDVLKYLVLEDANLTVTNNDGDTLQHYTCRYGMLDVLKYLVHEKDANLTVTNNDGDTLQHYTCRYGMLDVLKYLVHEKDANLNVTNNVGDTLQHYTCIYGMVDVLKYLVLEHNVDLKVTNNEGDTLLHYAAWQGQTNVVEYLIEQGADPAARNIAGERPVDMVDDDTPDRDRLVQYLEPSRSKCSIQ